MFAFIKGHAEGVDNYLELSVGNHWNFTHFYLSIHPISLEHLLCARSCRTLRNSK